MAGARFSDIVKPFAPYLPGVTRPPQNRKIPFNQRILWTVVVLLIFLVMGQIPLYGIVSADSSDPLMWLRMMLASNRGTLMELGTTPIVSSTMVFQLLSGTGLIDINQEDKNDRELLQTAQKLLAIILSLGQSFTYVMTGMYGVPSELGIGVCLLLIFQLVFAAVIVILLDELLAKGWGVGSGISLFVATNTCEQVLWKAFSPNTVIAGRGYEFEGAVISLVYLLATRRDKKHALVEAFTRTNLPNMSQVFVTAAIFFVVLYVQTLKLELPLRHTKTRGTVGTLPIRLFYTGNMPLMLQSALSSNIALISQMVYTRWPTSIAAKILGIWDARLGSATLSAVGGLVYYLQPPQTWYELVSNPIRTVFYMTYVLVACAMFSKTWLDISGTGPRDIARQLKDQNLAFMGTRESSSYKELKRIIPTAAALGGAAIGLLSVSCDFLGTLGTGTGILMSVMTIYSYIETAEKENGGQLF